MLFITLIACFDSPPEPEYVPRPDLVINGRNIDQTLPQPYSDFGWSDMEDLGEFDKCPIKELHASMGMPYNVRDQWMKFRRSGDGWTYHITLTYRPGDACHLSLQARQWD